MQHIKSTTILTALGVVFFGTAAVAQVIPNSARPEVTERRYRIQDEPTKLGKSSLIKVEDEKTKPIAGGMQFTLKGIKIEGETAYSEDELKPLYADKIGTKVTVGELNAIADDITKHYRNNGYILTRAVVPPQRADGGVITIRVVEGFINDVKITGDAADNSQIQLFADKIRASKPLNVAALERYLLLMDDLPGLEARAVLQPAANVPAASDVIVTVTRKKYEFTANLDNRGSRFLGPIQGGFTAGVNNVFRAEDQTQLRILSSILQPDEMIYAELRHEQQLGAEGTKAVISATHTVTHPDSAVLAPLDIVGISDSFSAGLIHPFLRSRQSNWFVNGDFTARNVDVNSLSTDLYADKTRVLSLGTSYDFIDSTAAITRMDLNLAQGLALGTKIEGQPHSRANGEDNFTKFGGRVSRIQPIDGPWSVYTIVSGQYSFDPLYASEEFALGGAEFGSAYDPAELTGDTGLAGRLELQYNDNPEGWVSQYQLYGFYDGGKVWNRSPVPGSESAHASLTSTGLGVRFNVADSVSGGLEGSVPLTHDVAANGTDGNASRLFFNLQYRY